MPSVTIYTSYFPEDFRAILPELREFISETLSNKDIQLKPEEVSIRICKIEASSLSLAPVEIDILAYAHPDRIKRQDDICVEIVDFICNKIDDLEGKCHVWLQLCELGHSWNKRKPHSY